MNTVITRIGLALRRFLAFAVGMLMAGIVILVAWQVLARYVLDVPTFESAEITRLMFIWLTFLGSGLLIGRRELIAIDLLHGMLSQRAGNVLGIVNEVLTAVTLIMLACYDIKLLALVGPKTAPAIGISYRWFYLSLLVFCCIGVFFILERLVTGETGQRATVPADLAMAKDILE
jgi:TRAP-type C4-dicarboxylate transport system permease small subunit